MRILDKGQFLWGDICCFTGETVQSSWVPWCVRNEVVGFLANTGGLNQSKACQVMTIDVWIRTCLEGFAKESEFEAGKTEEEAA